MEIHESVNKSGCVKWQEVEEVQQQVEERKGSRRKNCVRWSRKAENKYFSNQRERIKMQGVDLICSKTAKKPNLLLT